MYVAWGNFEFEPWEASLARVSVQAKFSPRQFRESYIHQMFVEGDVVVPPGDDQYDVTLRLEEIADALNIDNQDFGLYHDDGSPTRHYLPANSSLNMTGNQIFMSSFPAQVGGEYVNGRQFSFGVKAEFAAPQSSLLEYHDSIDSTGNCGPIYNWQVTDQGPRVDRVAPSSLQRVIHSGWAKTTVPWFAPPAPYYPEPFHLVHLRRIAYIGPQERYPRAYSGFITRWTYHYVLPVDTYNTPTVR